MHVPSCQTNQLELLTFAETLQNEQTAQLPYDRTQWIYLPHTYQEYRYLLGTRGENPLICIGINPSTAEPDNLDNTLKSVQRIALANGHDSFLMFNVYAQRATDPDHMEEACNADLHTQNMIAFEYVLSHCGQGVRPAVWAAWGTIIEKRPYLADCLRDMIALGQQYGAEWWSVGKISVKGHPHHPLYLPKNAQKERFDILTYTKVLQNSK